MMRRVILAIVVVSLLSVSSAGAATFIVNTTADTFDGVCNVTDCSLKDALDNAVATGAPDTIVLSNATYTITTPFLTVDGLPQIPNPVTIAGNGAVIERDPSAPAFRIFDVQGGSLTLQNVTVRNGSASGSASDGGGVYNNSGVLTVTDSVIENNFATQNGGGIYSAGPGPLTITRTSVRYNTAGFGGGLLALQFTNPQVVTIVDSAFIGNAAIDPGNGLGGGIDLSGDVDATITSTTVSGNTSSIFGGGIGFNSVPIARTITILNATIVNNTAAAVGGGISAVTCSQNCPNTTKPKLINTILANNAATGNPLTANCFSNYDSGGNNILGPPVVNNVNCFFLNQSNEILLPGTLGNIATLSTTGLPGGEHHDLQAGNVGIDNANNQCPATDQIASGRVVVCERGAIEFHPPGPVINPCQRGKKKCIAKKMKALLTCHAKAEKLGIPVSPMCLQTAYDHFSKCCTKLELVGNCLTIGDCQALEDKTDAFVLDVVQELDPAYPTVVQNNCSSKKKKCVAKKANALLLCHADAEKTGALSSKCVNKAHDAFDGGPIPSHACFYPLEQQGNCLTVNDVTALENKVDAYIDDVVCELDPQAGTCHPPTPTPTTTRTPTPVATPTATPTDTPTPSVTPTVPPCQLPQPADCKCQDNVTCSSGCPSGSGITCAQAQQGCIDLCTNFHGGPGQCPGACTDCATGLPCQ